MVSEWQSISIGALIEQGIITAHKDGNHGSNYPRTSEFGDRGVPFLTAKLIDDGGRIDLEGAPRLNQAKANKITFGYVQEGDVLLSHNATVGRVAIVPKIEEPILIGTSLTHYRLDEKRLLPGYLAAYFKGRDFQNQLAAVMSFSTRNQVPITAQRKLFVIVPPIEDQQAISQILGALDDKIELNRQMNATLESMAHAQFKSWFVDFDPVIDNMLSAGKPIPEALQAKAQRRAALGDQRQPLPADIQQLFPSNFVFTEELGWVPEGWEVSTVGEQVETTGGGTPSTKNADYWEYGTHAFCTPKDMSNLSSWVLMDTERHLTDAGVARISSGQLPSGTVLMSSRAPIGYLAISDIPVSVNQGIIAMLPNSTFGPLYLLNWARSNMEKVKDRANGSTFLEISKKNFRPIPFLVPDGQIAAFFNQQSEPMLSKLLLISEQTTTLTSIRDSLLPKLLSGQLRIPEAETQIAEVV